MTARTSSTLRRMMYTDPDLRVSDAERAEVADRLGRHYGDGRLDQEEFNERVGRAMSAKTQSDLSGLFDDLPPLPDEGVPARKASAHPVGRPARRHPVLLVAAIVVLAIGFAHALTWFFFPGWLVAIGLAVVAVYFLRGHEQHHHHGSRGDGPDAGRRA